MVKPFLLIEHESENPSDPHNLMYPFVTSFKLHEIRVFIMYNCIGLSKLSSFQMWLFY